MGGFPVGRGPVVSRRLRSCGSRPQPVHRRPRTVRESLQSPREGFYAALARWRYHLARVEGRDRNCYNQVEPAMNTPVFNAPPYGLAMVQDDLLTEGVLSRRCFAWFVDLALIAIIVAAMWVALFTFGIMTLGLGMPLLGLLPL